MRFLLNCRFPLILGNDFSGVVVKVGERVNTFKPEMKFTGDPAKTGSAH